MNVQVEYVSICNVHVNELIPYIQNNPPSDSGQVMVTSESREERSIRMPKSFEASCDVLMGQLYPPWSISFTIRFHFCNSISFIVVIDPIL